MAQQKEFWTQRFYDVGWQTDRFLEGMKTTDNFYCHEVVQVRTDTWHQGRVVLLVDAAHCPSPFSGMGTTSSFIGAHVLAGEINQDPENLPQAFVKYAETLRPFVNEIQKVNPVFLRMAIPDIQMESLSCISLQKLLCFLRISDLISRLSKEEKGDWKLSDYPELSTSQ